MGAGQEWTLDYYDIPFMNPCTDCIFTDSASGNAGRMVRGGDCYEGAQAFADRYGQAPTNRVMIVRFRCARTP
jgi:hypothetical protein